MRRFLARLLVAMVAFAPVGPTLALPDPDARIEAHTGLEMVVMEADGCIYCGLFRRDVLPAFEASERGRTLPVRFMDVNDVDTAPITLSQPIDILPTFVVLKDHKEIGRIPGYVGPETFFQSINYVLSAYE